ncbi:MAG: alpha-2-macroglobulin family protein, partial [Cruoricaptor ignavus]|nr:alpha-2-macroglobulin family protein [Cruoricaptor ignavus]
SQFFKKISTAGNSLKGKDKLLYDAVSGRFFNDYYSRNSWRVNGRTNMQRSDKEVFGEDVETWTNRDFKNYFTQYFANLETRKKELQNIKLSDYKTIFSDVEYLDYFPSLLDWNAVNEIDFLKDRAFFTPKELQNNHQKIIAIYDNLITENQGNAKLYFQHQKLNYNCTFTKCKDKLSQLQNLYNSATEGDYKVMIIGEIMSQLSSERKYTEAVNWAKTAKKEYPKSQFLGNIINEENEIINPVLVLKYETETLANQPIHLVAEAKNINQFSLNIYELKENFSNFLKYVQNPYSGKLKNFKKSLVRKQNFDLRNTKDYESYKTSLEIQPLPSGIYIVEYAVENTDVQGSFYFVASKSKTIDINKNEKNPKENQLRLVDRNSGTSIANEELKIYEFGGKTVKTTNAKTDKSANFQLPISADDYRTFLVHQPKTNDFNIIQVYDNRYYAGPNPKNKAQIFLDRAIYRPGQIVYFKVINTQLLNNKESVASGISQKISLYDANGEELSSQNFTTNSFGSYHGSFVLPKGKLNGQFSLRIDDKNSYKSFRVEEYKRPKFEVTFEPIKGEYAYGQTIELKGKAEMFSGVALSNATVNYEIKKQNIRWRYFPWYPMGNDNENSILGETKTNEKGEFTITLNLQKNETLEGVQIDNYQVNASVTDINGETQSATENVRVASVSHYIKTDEIKDAFTDENMVVNVELRNYNDQILNKSYQAKLSKLSGNNRVFRQNFEYEIQDLPQYSEKEFIQKFPHDYFNKKEKENRVESVVWQRTENPENSTSKTLDLGRLDAGKYKLELYNIEGKDTIKTEKIFEVFSKKSLSPSQKTFLKVVSPKTEFNRNEKPKVYVYSAIPNALVNIFVQHGDGSTKTEQKTLKNGVLEYEVSFPKDENITFVNLQFQIVAYNDVQTERVNLKITSDKKPLQIETITFRDKLQPAQKEKWTVKISGNEKENINAELLANMYDMSLDQFAINSYSWQALFRNNFVLNSYGTRNRLAEEYYAKRINYRNNAYVRFPNFDWFANEINVRAYGMKQPLYAPLAMAKDSSKVSTIESVVVYETKVDGITPMENEQLNKIPIRENLNETAFFYPNLITDKNGNVSFEFTSPEALTKWKLMFLAHTKDAQVAVLQKEVVTQKEFSVTPNYPRFLREGDEINLQTKISSLINEKLSGTAQLQILDAFSNQDISEQFGLKNARQNFELNENGNTVATWKINVPKDISTIIIKVVATSTPLSAQGSFSDGEQKAIAVLPNRMLVTD